MIEIKDDSEIENTAPENQKKFEYALAHFSCLNEWLKEEGINTVYQVNFLTPKAFNRFFNQLRKDQARAFVGSSMLF